MGIKDLLRYMKPFIEPIHIKKYAGKRVKTRHFPQNFQRIYPFFFNNFFYKIESHLLLISAFFWKFISRLESMRIHGFTKEVKFFNLEFFVI